MAFFKSIQSDPLQKQLSNILIYGADGPKTKTSWNSVRNLLMTNENCYQLNYLIE